MNRIATIAAAATLVAAPAFAAQHEGGGMDEQMTMLQQRLQEALAECNVELDEEQMMNLTMAQVSGIVLTSGSSDGSNECEEVSAIANDS